MDWELSDGDNVRGPFTEQQVIDGIGRGLAPTTLCRPVGKEKWKPIGAHLPFAAALEQGQAPQPAPAPAAPGSEAVFMQQDDVLITNKRAVLRGTMYPLANITSVRLYEKRPTKALLIIGLLLVLYGGLLSMLSDFQSGPGLSMLLGGMVLAGFHFAAMRSTYWVRISTAAGEVNAVGYQTPARAQKVVDALSNAIVSRSA